MKILYGTTNPAKLSSMRLITEPLGIELIGLKDINKPLPEIDESGNNPLENAVIKAKAYYNAFNMPVFSCDSGLYFDGVDDALQPGVHVRRVGGRELTDTEMTDYYANLAKKHNDSLIARYRNAICLIFDNSHIYTCMDMSIATETFKLISTPHQNRVEGFPLDCLSVDIKTDKYYYDLEEKSLDQEGLNLGFKNFFTKALIVYKQSASA